MAKKPSKSGKETIKPPSKSDLKAAAKGLPKGDKPSGRVMADESVAVRQRVVKKSPKKH